MRALSVEETAVRLGLHEETVRRFAREGRLPAFKAGRSWRFAPNRLDDWMDNQHAFSHRPCVLVVDDEEEFRRLVALNLEGEGYHVDEDATPEEAIERIRRSPPDVVILDLKFPNGKTGIPVIREISTGQLQIPVIIVSGYPDSDLMFEALSYAPLIVLSKPLVAGRLLEAVRTAVHTAPPGVRALAEVGGPTL